MDRQRADTSIPTLRFGCSNNYYFVASCCKSIYKHRGAYLSVVLILNLGTDIRMEGEVWSKVLKVL